MISVKIDSFEGPLDLLLHLIDKAEVDIYEISVAEITDQYVEYIGQMQELELEIASEFIVMAATLLAIKSRMLLPKKEELSFQPMFDMDVEELDPREELIMRLIEYKKFKGLALQLREKETERSKVFTRPAENLSVFIENESSNPVANVSLFDLLEAFQTVLQEKKTAPMSRVDRDEISIESRMGQIKAIISERKRIPFSQLFDQYWTKDQVIVTFLAVLEMMKKKEIACEQTSLFSDIWISQYVEEV
ncbi:segregation and condensation protein A [Caldalkalibacillus mannanilyticus]|uniref:segregation and condensation protein A n=1 Tax=Caldalkalibacillus mannanilyticus TaxID=1418 RepID=UPI00046A1B51|nr:segregation/condensation protein A [Caldalkalibacillus mannanilyticus]